jgi:hypothetical protein
MKTLFFILSSLVISQASLASQMGSVLVSGPAAEYLFDVSESGDESFVQCYLAHQVDGKSPAECRLYVTEAESNSKGTVVISGVAATEIYESVDPVDTKTVSCYRALDNEGKTQIECKLQGYIVEAYL